jgi:protein TonB
MPAHCFATPKPTAEWRHCGPFLLLALALHGAALAYPLAQRAVPDIAPTLSATLIERAAAPLAAAQAPAAQRSTPTTNTPKPASASHKLPPAKPQTLLSAPIPERPSTAQTAVPPAVEMKTASASTANNHLVPTSSGSATSAINSPSGNAANAVHPATTAARFDAAYLNNPRPDYPNLSRRLGEQGKVLLRVRVGSDGQALAVNVEKSSEFSRLDDAALRVVGRWRFIPARRGNEAIETSVIVPIVFQLES